MEKNRLNTGIIFMLPLIFMLFSGFNQSVHAQGAVNINVTGIPPVIQAPFTDQFEQNFRNGRYQVIFTYNNNNSRAVDFRFQFSVSRGGREVLEVTSDPRSFRPGAYVFTSVFDELPFPQTFEQVINQIENDIKKQIVQGGTIPEGNYMLNIEAIPEDDAGMIASPQSVTPFTVRYPQPPILINPSNNSNLTLATPVFNWTPVAIQGFTLQYDFLLVEVLDNQTPLQAINSNRAHAQRTLVGQNTLPYTPEFLPLDEGQEYAWRITARAPNQPIPLKDDGESPIRTFVYKQGAGGLFSGIDGLQSIPLVPGYARLINLQNLEVDEQANAYALNGQATLELDNGQTQTLSVDVNNLLIQKGSPDNPNVMGGKVYATGALASLPVLNSVSNIVDFTKLRWTYSSGVEATGKLQLPNNTSPQANGWIQLTSQGLSGQLVAENPNGVISVGDDPVKLSLNRFEASFPERQLYATGEVDLFNGQSTCDITQLNVLEDESEAVFNCPDDVSIELVEDSAQLQLLLDNLSGVVDYNFDTDEFAYDLTADGNLGLGVDQAGQCSAYMQVTLDDVDGFGISQVTPSCSVYAPPLDLGFIKLKLDDVDLQTLAYNGSGNWDFDIQLDGALTIPAMDDWTMPLTSVNITPQGLRFPDLDWDAVELGLDEPLAIEGFRIEPIRFTMPQFTFPWFDWTQEDIDDDKTGDWAFDINFDFHLPDFSDQDGNGTNDNILPPCLAAKSITGVRAGFSDGELAAGIPATALRDCRIELADKYTFIINELGGELMATASASSLNLESEIDLDAEFEAGYPFTCNQGKPSAIAQTKLTMGSSGLLEGSIKDIVNHCQARLGPFQAGITQSDLIFEIDQGQQQLAIEAGGELALNDKQKVSGSLIYDVLNGQFDELDFTYDDPFLLNLPSERQTVLSFLVDKLNLTEDGILINGRHQFVIGDPQELSTIVQNQTGQKINLPEEVTTIDVTFDNTLIGLKDLGIKSGRIIFDESFALKAGVDEQTTDISYNIIAADKEIELDPNSLYTTLAGRLIIDKHGLHAGGQAEAGVRVGDLQFDDIGVDFRDNFAMGLQPFGVQQGRADLLHKSRRIAYINSSGFHFDPSYLTQAIPDTIPLPTKDAAYIVLRDPNTDDLLVQAQQETDGTYTMSTTNPVDLVVPAIQGTQPQAPSVGVTFTSITYDPGSGEITAGAIEGNFNPAIDLNEMGVPLRLKSIRYDNGLAVNDQSFGSERGLFLQGDLLLYEHQVGDQGSVALYLENGNRLRGDVDLKNLNSDISIVPQSDLAVLNVDSLQGSINVPLDQAQFPNVSLDMGGQLRFQNSDEIPLAALNYRATYDDEQFNVNAINQPGSSSSHTAFVGQTGFRIDKINTLSLSYRSATNDFDFRSELDFSILMNLQDGDTLQVPLKEVAITENGISIPSQDINSSSDPVLNAPPVSMGPAELTLLEFRILQDITFNWFTGEGVPPSFEMDLEMTLAALGDKAPQASTQSLSLYNVGYNQGVFTGSIEDFSPQGNGMPVGFGDTKFNITTVSGGLINDGTVQNPTQGYDINLTGNVENNSLFNASGPNCTNPTFDLNLSRAGGLVGAVNNITPCGDLEYGPATIAFDPNSSLSFTFNNDTQGIVLDGSVAAEIEQDNSPNITATGDIEVDVINGDLINGSILVNDPFTYNFPQNKSLFTFRVQQARLDQTGLVFTGDAGLTFPNSTDTARVAFTNFTIEPQNDVIAGGSFTVQDSLAFEVGVSPVDWKVVDPLSNFTRDNAGRLLLAAGLTVDTNGLTLNGSSTASIRAAGQSFPDLSVDYTGFQVGIGPTSVTAGQADFTIEGESSSFGYLDKDKFHLNLPGLITSVVPDTLDLPNRDTAFLVLGDDDGSRYELDESQSTRKLQTLPDKTVELVIPNVQDDNGDPLKVQVAFDVAVDDYMKIASGSVSLESTVDLEPYLDIPLSLDSLSYSSSTQELRAAATVQLPSTLNGAELATTAVIGNNGFEQATISAGEYSDTYFPSQENVQPIVADTLGNDALAFYVRGLEIELGQTNSIAFSGQLKSDLLQDSQGEKTPIHYAAGYDAGQWNVAIDNGNLSSGIDLGYAQLEAIPGDNSQLFDVTMNDQEFAVAFAGIISMPELLGDGFSLEVQQLKISSAQNADGDYVTVNAQQNLPDQNFQLINGILDLTSTNTSISLTNKVLAIQTSGSFDFYNKQDISFQNLEFRSDGTVDIGGVSSGNMLGERIEILSDSSLVLKDLSLGVTDNALKMSATGFAKLPKPLDERADLTISADTDGNVDVSGPDFIFDDGFNIGNNPDTEFGIDNFATLELTGLGIDLNFSDPAQTALYAAGAVYIENDTEKRIMFGDAGNLQQDPGIKYTPGGGVEWNVSSSFDPNNSPFSFDYEFFSVSIASINIETDVTVDGEQVPFQAEIGGNAGLNIAGVGGSADFAGFKFSTLGVDEVGRIEGGGSFTLMDIVSLELGSFDYETAEENGGPFTLEFAEGSGGGDEGASVDTVQVDEVVKYLHFKPGSGGQALQLSLCEGISGGVQEVLFYQKSDGERYFRIKKASLQISDQASIVAGMEFINKPNEGFSLAVAGGGSFTEVGIAAAGNISTINNNLRFGIFVAVKAPISFLGIVELSNVGGGFYYRPKMKWINDTIEGVKGMNPAFELNGPQPEVDNLKFAVMFYAGVSIVGTGNYAAFSGNTMIQITDQFTKIDANGFYLGQQNRFVGGMYLTILYTDEIAGIEGGAMLEILYDPVMSGTSEVDFFATKDRTNDNADVLWGITGNFELAVLPDLNMLNVKGEIVVSPNGLLLDLKAGSQFDLAVISADASFEMMVWYLPDNTVPVGIYGKFSVSFSIVGGLAEFGASVEGGYFKQPSYHMIYFAGEAYVSVFGVIDANVRGWVRVQTKSPLLDFGRGGNAEMEQMISDAKDKANETKEKAEETKDQLNDAKDELNDALAEAGLEGYSDEQLRRAGYNIVSGEYFATGSNYNRLNDVINAERDIRGNNSLPDIIYWIQRNVMGGSKPAMGGSPSGYSATRERPSIRQPGPTSVSNLDDFDQIIGTQAYAMQQVKDDAPAVEARIENAVTELGTLSSNMRTSLEEDNTLSLENPVSNVQDVTTAGGGEMVAPPSFQIDEDANDENKSQLETFENDLTAADQRYQDAIKAAAANIELIDLVVSGESSVSWGSETGVQLQAAPGESVNDLAYTYTNAVKEVRDYNAELIGSFWNMGEWAQVRYDLIVQNEQAIEDFVEQVNTPTNPSNINSFFSDLADAAEKRVYLLTSAMSSGLSPAAEAQEAADYILNDDFSISDRSQKYKQTGMEFWFKSPKFGLDELKTRSNTIADSLQQVFDQKVGAIESKHKAFTESVDRLYTIKSEMLVTVYGMIEEYNAWRQEAFGQQAQNTEAPFTDKVQEIEQTLAPPTIDFISGKGLKGDITDNYFGGITDYRDFYGTASLSYQATHPQGIPEMSYSLLDGTVGSVYLVSDYYSAGVWNSEGASGADRRFKMKFPKENVGQTDRNLTGVVRARGAGGTTVARFVNFTIPVGPGGTIPQNATVVEMGDDTSPPTTPNIDHEYPIGPNNYWTPDSTQLSFTFKSADNESDIRLYKYKIGTTKGGNDVRTWTEAQGTRGVGAWFIFPYSKIETTLRGLSLQPGTDYYLSVKSVNGDNMESTVKEVSKPFQYDPTPPSRPEITITPSNLQRQAAPTQPVIRQAVTDIPAWNGNRINYDQGSDDGQEFTYTWTASDPESGIKGVSIGTAQSPDATASQVFRPNDIDFVPTSEATEFSWTPQFSSNLYLYFRARNNADMKSGMRVLGPIENIDVTVPTTPDARVSSGFDGFNIYITQLSDDIQSGIKGYQYAILDSAGTDTLRAWPDSSTVDFDLNNNASSAAQPVPEFIPAGTFTETGYFKVAVRAINNQNMASRAVLNEDIFVDRSPPTKTVATVVYSGTSKGKSIFKINFSKIGEDPESGLQSMYYDIEFNNGQVGTTSLLNMQQRGQSASAEIRNFSTKTPSYILLGDAYFENHTYDTETVQINAVRAVLQSLPTFVIVTRNNAGLETRNTVQLRIPPQLMQQYLDKLISVHQPSQENQNGAQQQFIRGNI